MTNAPRTLSSTSINQLCLCGSASCGSTHQSQRSARAQQSSPCSNQLIHCNGAVMHLFLLLDRNLLLALTDFRIVGLPTRGEQQLSNPRPNVISPLHRIDFRLTSGCAILLVLDVYLGLISQHIYCQGLLSTKPIHLGDGPARHVLSSSLITKPQEPQRSFSNHTL